MRFSLFTFIVTAIMAAALTPSALVALEDWQYAEYRWRIAIQLTLLIAVVIIVGYFCEKWVRLREGHVP